MQYDDAGGATAALVVYGDANLGVVVAEHVTHVDHVAAYEPGALYRRELPCLREVLALHRSLELLIVDGYATLDPHGRPGLGAHAADAFQLPVIGVAKTPFRAATHAIPVLRGSATRPLYVTVAGDIDIVEAAHLVATMHGLYRIPTALTRVDQLARGLRQPGVAAACKP